MAKMNNENLTQQAKELSDAITKRINRADFTNLTIRISFILGGGLAATIGGLMPAPAVGEIPWKSIIGIGGAVLTLLGGLALLFLEQDQTSDMDKARRAIETARVYLSNREEIQRQFDDMRKLDSKRRSLISALQAMREVSEQSAYTGEVDTAKSLKDLFDVSLNQLLPAMGYQSGEFHSISVYKVRSVSGEDELLEGLVDRRSNRIEEVAPGRTWAMGEGFTGAAWQRNSELIIDDSAHHTIKSAFYVPDGKIREDDHERYRSIASFPIRVGTEGKVWGIVTISSDMVGRFSTNGAAGATQNVEAARTVAGMVALLVGITYINSKKLGIEEKETSDDQEQPESA
ncbi:hypothetical protein PsAD14_03859 [Pseudovibrio sp. Ad14]|nr:hypothetical protein PsW74_02899 [Pseudovibrio sp. W74]KZL07473.1 hypothetical protein PsAD14_03859 [Pseudovibrio sp. Ad14]